MKAKVSFHQTAIKFNVNDIDMFFHKIFYLKTRDSSSWSLVNQNLYYFLFAISLCFTDVASSDCSCNRNRNHVKKIILGLSQNNGICFNVNFQLITTRHVTQNMVRIAGGDYLIGTDQPIIPQDGEAPKRNIRVNDFFIDQFEISNREFHEFVTLTGYKSDAEKYGNSFVLYSSIKNDLRNRNVSAVAAVPWWLSIDEADWRHPEGPGSSVTDRWNHPVIHVSWFDAISYCNWVGKRLPTEAEWEIACRGGIKDQLFAWGNNLLVNGKHKANIWQGVFPLNNTAEDGFEGTAPINAFHQNKYGLYNIIGNVWEWTNDWWSTKRSKTKNNLKGTDKVKKGGSYMCHKDYCYRYRCAARSQNTPDTTAANLGFRCARDATATKQ